MRFHGSVDRGRISSQFIFFSLKVRLARKYIESNMRQTPIVKHAVVARGALEFGL